jgi:hypothetical protein
VTRRYLILFLGLLAAATALHLIGKARGRQVTPAAPAAAPLRDVSVELRAGSVTSRPASVAVGERLALTLVNHSGRRVRVSLSGYEDRLAVSDLAADSVWHGTLIADRPGEELAWLVDGAPAGRFDVTGSHLIEGHR